MKPGESAAAFIKRKEQVFLRDKERQKLVQMKDIGRKGKHGFFREAWTFLPQGNLKEKVFVLERLRKTKKTGSHAYAHSWKQDQIEYRIGYYIIGRIGRARGRWIWGQFCPLIPSQDLKRLFSKARKKGTILRGDL